LDFIPAATQIEVLPGAKTPSHIGNFGPGVRQTGRWSAMIPIAA
jgi:hypothetical protein